MTRGNQREKAREKNLKKNTKQAKAAKKDDGVSYKKRAQSDAEIMRQKQQKALEKKTGSSSGDKVECFGLQVEDEQVIIDNKSLMFI
ncbi:9526_t:CDS:2 [Paraglomus occultum]|uniref:9526_t:CDS:1 n=1 Tax=Paraglomus occultum TaxID=144539 RepID=A0A9N8W8I7_9GLOM|nr:9526_t:CDS:2 [Paraglomus occultum]